MFSEKNEKRRPNAGRRISYLQLLLLLLLALALLICNAAARLARRLAGSLAFAAAAVLCALAEAASFDGLDMTHDKVPPSSECPRKTAA